MTIAAAVDNSAAAYPVVRTALAVANLSGTSLRGPVPNPARAVCEGQGPKDPASLSYAGGRTGYQCDF
jgi:hypothetical protein